MLRRVVGKPRLMYTQVSTFHGKKPLRQHKVSTLVSCPTSLEQWRNVLKAINVKMVTRPITNTVCQTQNLLCKPLYWRNCQQLLPFPLLQYSLRFFVLLISFFFANFKAAYLGFLEKECELPLDKTSDAQYTASASKPDNDKGSWLCQYYFLVFRFIYCNAFLSKTSMDESKRLDRDIFLCRLQFSISTFYWWAWTATKQPFGPKPATKGYFPLKPVARG